MEMMKKKKKPWLAKFKDDFKNKKVLVMGLGLQGRGAADAKFFAEIGAEVTVTDLKTREQLKHSLKALKGLPIRFVLGKHRQSDFKNCDIVLRNADVSQNSPFLKIAQKAGAQVVMDESLFASYAPVKIIGVTGSRGKTTTATLIYQILKKSLSAGPADKSVYLAGNILGTATLPLLKKVKKDDWVVLELSSWQLQGFISVKMSPNIGIITSISPDHLNRYGSMDEYIADKKAIFKYQNSGDFILLNKDQKIVRDLASQTKSKIIFFSKDDLPDNWRLNIYGGHNRANAAAAVKTAQLLSIKLDIVKEVVENFPAVEYRLQKVAEIDGKTIINDTTSTTPTALKAAVNAFDKPIVLICGGASKNLPLENAAAQVAKKAKKIILLSGSGTFRLKKALLKYKAEKKIVAEFDNLKQAAEKAVFEAAAGEIVLFSPGFTSFEMFDNEFDRGRKFNKEVLRIKSALSAVKHSSKGRKKQ